VREDLLAMLYRLEETHAVRRLSNSDACAAVGSRIAARWALLRLVRNGRIQTDGGRLALTDLGRDEARTLVRSHRLWEAYLVEQLGFPPDHVHEPAHRVEHYIDEDMREQIKAGIDAVDVDPHGRVIPGS
jgi:Mn-dependent DtxR family transcriptional regulator